MAVPAGQLVDLVLRRVRDPFGLATSRAFVRQRLSEAQWAINLAVPSVLRTCTMPTHASRVVYDLATIGLTHDAAPVDREDVLRVESIRLDGRDLVRMPWRAYATADARWLRHPGDAPRTWARMGIDLLLLHPAPRIDGTITLLYVARTAQFSSDDIPSEVRDDRLPALLSLTEALLLLHRRLFAPMTTALTNLDTELARLPGQIGSDQAGARAGAAA